MQVSGGRLGGNRVLNINYRVICTLRHQPVTAADEWMLVSQFSSVRVRLFELRTHEWHWLIRENLIAALDQVSVDSIAFRLKIGGGGGEEDLFCIDAHSCRRAVARFLVVHGLEQLADLMGEVEDFRKIIVLRLSSEGSAVLHELPCVGIKLEKLKAK